MKIKNLIPWIARGLSVIITLGTFAFVFELSPKDFEWSNIFLAAIPGTILLVVTAVAWNFPKPGGLIFILLGLLYAVLGWYRVSYVAIGVLSGALILAGLTFIFGKKEESEEKVVKNVKLERTNEPVKSTTPTPVTIPSAVTPMPIVSEPIDSDIKPVEPAPILPALGTPKSAIVAQMTSQTADAKLPVVDKLQTSKLPEIEDTPDDVDMPAILPVKLPELKTPEETLPKEDLDDSFANLQVAQTPTVSTTPQRETIGTQTISPEKPVEALSTPSTNVFEDLTKKDDIGMAPLPPVEKEDSLVEIVDETIPSAVIDTPLPPLDNMKDDVPELFTTDSEISIPDEKADEPIVNTDLNDVLPVIEPSIPSTTTLPTTDDQSTANSNQSLPDWLTSTSQNQTTSQQDDSGKTDLLTNEPEIEVEEPAIEGFEDSVLIPLEDDTKQTSSLRKITSQSSPTTIPNVTLTSGSKMPGIEEKTVASTMSPAPTPSQVANLPAPSSNPAAKNDTFMDWFKPEDLQQKDPTEE